MHLGARVVRCPSPPPLRSIADDVATRATVAALATRLEDAALALYDADPDDALLEVIALAATRHHDALAHPLRRAGPC